MGRPQPYSSPENLIIFQTSPKDDHIVVHHDDYVQQAAPRGRRQKNKAAGVSCSPFAFALFSVFIYTSIFYIFNISLSYSLFFNNTKFWFFICNTLILNIIAADYGVSSSSNNSLYEEYVARNYYKSRASSSGWEIINVAHKSSEASKRKPLLDDTRCYQQYHDQYHHDDTCCRRPSSGWEVIACIARPEVDKLQQQGKLVINKNINVVDPSSWNLGKKEVEAVMDSPPYKKNEISQETHYIVNDQYATTLLEVDKDDDPSNLVEMESKLETTTTCNIVESLHFQRDHHHREEEEEEEEEEGDHEIFDSRLRPITINPAAVSPLDVLVNDDQWEIVAHDDEGTDDQKEIINNDDEMMMSNVKIDQQNHDNNDYAAMSDEELNTRVEEFITKLKRQIRLQAGVREFNY